MNTKHPPHVTHETEPPQTTPRVTEPGTAGGSPHENVSGSSLDRWCTSVIGEGGGSGGDQGGGLG